MAEACFNHPQIEAVTRCTHCHKPICPQCMIYREGSVFCTEDCAVAMNALSARVGKKLESARENRGLLADFVKAAVFGLAVLLVLEWFHITSFLGIF